MCDEQFDTSFKLRQLFEKKQEQRAAAKKYYQKLLYSPNGLPEGVPFDPALHRYCAMSAYHIENFVPKPKHFLGFFLVYFGPPTLATFLYLRSFRKKEAAIRSGEVSYEERKSFVF